MQARCDQATASPPVRQRAELTFKHNVACGRHGWLRLTPAYSVKVVEGILRRANESLHVLDPFSGTGTTALCAATHGHDAVALEINPFLVWFGLAKVARYDHDTLSMAETCAEEVMSLAAQGTAPVAAPPIANVERWWSPKRLEYLCCLMGAIRAVAPEPGPVQDLLLVAFCRTMMALSNAAFNHQSMSFKDSRGSLHGHRGWLPFTTLPEEKVAPPFHEDIQFVLAGAAENPLTTARVQLADSRSIPLSFEDGADLLITSPPYPNRISYTRELRPYMYWLGFLRHSREAGELDWRAIGGTWGIATSRALTWERRADTYFPDYLPGLLDRIRSSDAKSGEILGNYVGKYFEDMWEHFLSVTRVMKRGAAMHYIVGNSKFYEVVVPAEELYRDMLLNAGAREAEIIPLRKRNSKKELVEFDVVATV
jgi:DNA modification methylase